MLQPQLHRLGEPSVETAAGTARGQAMIALASSTGQPQIDEIIRGIIGLFETVFPGRIRGCYLVGSYADGSAVALSDIDLRVVFKEGFADSAEEEQVRRVRGYCRLNALRKLCQRVLSFENHYLARYGDYLLTHLQSERRDHQLFAARRLKHVVFPGLRAALAAVETGDEELRQAIDAAQDVCRRAAPGLMG
jgi:Nucleotidyltransferase domain